MQRKFWYETYKVTISNHLLIQPLRLHTARSHKENARQRANTNLLSWEYMGAGLLLIPRKVQNDMIAERGQMTERYHVVSERGEEDIPKPLCARYVGQNEYQST